MRRSQFWMAVGLAGCVLSGATACSERAAEDFIEDALVRRAGAAELTAAPGTIQLPASTLLAASPAFGMPTRVWAIRDQLLVADQARGPTLHVVDGTTGALRRSVGRWGRGPGEFESVVAVDTVAGMHGIASLYDYNLQRITYVSIDSLLTRGIHVVGTAGLGMRPESVAWLPNGRLITANASDSSIVQRFDMVGARLKHVPLAALKVPSSDSLFLRTAYRARICGAQSARAALAFRYTSQVVIADVVANRDVAANVPHAFGPAFIDLPIVGHRLFKGGAPGVRYAYIDCDASEDAIYALFSGRLIGKYDRARDNAARFVHRFDWSGRLTAAWQLDHDAYSITVMDTVLITIAGDDVPTLRRTRIPRSDGVQTGGAEGPMVASTVSHQTKPLSRPQTLQPTPVVVVSVSVADSSGGQPRSWYAMVETRDEEGKPHRLQVFISPRVKAKGPQGNPIPLPGIVAGDRVKFWLMDIMRLSEPAQAFADSLQVVSRSPRSPG